MNDFDLNLVTASLKARVNESKGMLDLHDFHIADKVVSKPKLATAINELKTEGYQVFYLSEPGGTSKLLVSSGLSYDEVVKARRG